MLKQNWKRVQPLAPDFVKVYESPEPETIYTYSPGICVLPTGRIIATLDLSGPGLEKLEGPMQTIEWGKLWFGKVFTSDDGGSSWQHRADFPFMHARPFTARGKLYVMGHCNDLAIMCSEDNGETWGETSILTYGQVWHQAPQNVHYRKGNVYLVMERLTLPGVRELRTHLLAPVLMRASEDADLTKSDSWTFASELTLRQATADKPLDLFGVPFYTEKDPMAEQQPEAGTKTMYPIGWLEANIVEIMDERHYLYDATGATLHLWMRGHTGSTGYATLAKVIEHEDGSMTTKVETAPSGKSWLFVPLPGGQMNFHIAYDRSTELYWLLSSQATDSMTRAHLLPPERGSNSNNERHRLQLHFSRNCIDWCFAGLVAMTQSPRQARHYASMAIDGEDLLVLSRSGDEHAMSSHDGNFISFHRIEHFRSLVY